MKKGERRVNEGEIADAIMRRVRKHRGYPAGALTRDVRDELAPSQRAIREVLRKLVDDGELTADWHGNIVEPTQPTQYRGQANTSAESEEGR